MNYQDIIFQLAEQVTLDLEQELDIIINEENPELKELLKTKTLSITNDYLIDVYARTQQIGFSDVNQINEFVNFVDLSLHVASLQHKGLIDNVSDNLGEEHTFLTSKGKQVLAALNHEEE